MKTKLIPIQGVAPELLVDGPVEVEIIDIDGECTDYDALDSYMDGLRKQWEEDLAFLLSLEGMPVEEVTV